MTPVLDVAQGVTLIGGGALTAADLHEALALAPVVMAADGGADQALVRGIMPDAVVGDFDSLSDAARRRIAPDRLHHVAEQNSTDFAKCLMRLRAPFVLAVGFSGQRLDHTLAALHVMVRYPRPPVILLAAEDITFLAPPDLRLALPAGARVSLFPMGPVHGISTGLRWPIDGIAFAPDRRVGTSNEALGPVTLALDGPMLVMLPREFLGLALAALT